MDRLRWSLVPARVASEPRRRRRAVSTIRLSTGRLAADCSFRHLVVASTPSGACSGPTAQTMDHPWSSCGAPPPPCRRRRRLGGQRRFERPSDQYAFDRRPWDTTAGSPGCVDHLQAARSVEVKSSLAEPNGPPIQGDVTITSNGDAAGTASVPIGTNQSLTTTYREIGGKDYLLAPAAFWAGTGYSAEAEQLGGHWVVAPAGAIHGLANTSVADITTPLNYMARERLTLGSISTIDGVPSVPVRSSLGTLWVAVHGSHRPIELVESHSQGTVSYSNWDDAQPITAPSTTVPLPS